MFLARSSASTAPKLSTPSAITKNIAISTPLSSVSPISVGVAAARDGHPTIAWKAKAANVPGQSGKPVIIWRVDIVFLEKSDWKYEKSSAGELGGGRTHTFGVKNAAKKLSGKAVYKRKDVIIRDGKPIPRNGNEE